MATKTQVSLGTISYVILYVRNTEEALKFYRDTLGLQVKMHEDGWVELDTGSTTLALHHDEHAGKERTGSQPVVVFSVEDIYGAYETLKNRGVKFAREPQTVCETGDHIGKSADFTDPEGNQLSIFGMVPAKK